MSNGPGQGVAAFQEATYECLRCGERITASQMAELPAAKSICGYTIFRKVRTGVVKQVRAL